MPARKTITLKKWPSSAGTRLSGSAEDKVKTVLTNYLDDNLRAFINQLSLCRKHCSADSIHDLRIALRRLMAVWRALDPKERYGGKSRRKLKVLLKKLGPARDAGIRHEYFSIKAHTLPEMKEAWKLSEKEEMSEIIRVTGIASRKSSNEILKIAGGEGRDLLSCGRYSEKTLSAALKKGIDSVEKAWGRLSPDNPRTIHACRVAFKKLRYLVEIMQPLHSALKPKLLEQMRTQQRRMGKIQDLEVTARWLKKKGCVRKTKIFNTEKSIRNSQI